MTQDDEQRARLDQWWQRRSAEERAVLIGHRRGELSADYWRMVMDAEPLEPNKPPIVAIVSDNRTGRFRLAPILAEYVELKATQAST
jgi:hypothetical protein